MINFLPLGVMFYASFANGSNLVTNKGTQGTKGAWITSDHSEDLFGNRF